MYFAAEVGDEKLMNKSNKSRKPLSLTSLWGVDFLVVSEVVGYK
ncbi:hypothetical protein [Metabacillus endolithicus]